MESENKIHEIDLVLPLQNINILSLWNKKADKHPSRRFATI